jgi:histidinol-phosphate/aromatic aminotransferase/cobyric acid decarboxylase-like protein
MTCGPYSLALPGIQGLSPYEPGKPIEDLAREHGLDPASIVKLASNENRKKPQMNTDKHRLGASARRGAVPSPGDPSGRQQCAAIKRVAHHGPESICVHLCLSVVLRYRED